MSQINTNFQEIISNNSNNNNQSNALDNVTGTAIITSEALQGFSMANQFAICANSGNGPVLLSCLTPMLLPTLTGNNKGGFELTGGDGRGQQTVQIQLASPFNITGGICGANNSQSLPSLGLSYINLSSLTNAGGSFPLHITLNNAPGNNGTHQISIPTATLNNINQEVQIAQNYQISSQVKFDQELHVSGVQQQQIQQQQQHTVVNRIQDISDNDDKIRRKPRRRIPNKSIKTITSNNEIHLVAGEAQGPEERLLDHKGRPFIYNCPSCPKKFTLNSRLTAHLRCHTGIRPYTCTQCGFSFTQKSYLIRHAAVHTEERPFTCERCLKTYKHYGSLANHRKLHRKQDKHGTSDVSDSQCLSDQVKIEDTTAVTTAMTTTTTTTIISEQANHDNILQLHSDWSTVASDNSNTYLVSNTTADNSATISYYTESSHLLPGTGPVAFPEHHQQLTPVVHSQTFCDPRDSNDASQPMFVDLHLSSGGANENSTIIYTHVELAADPCLSTQQQQQQTYSSTFSTTGTV